MTILSGRNHKLDFHRPNPNLKCILFDTHYAKKKWLRDFFKKNVFLQIFTKYPHAHSAQYQTREMLQMKRHTRPALMRPTAKIRTQVINIRESAVNVMVQ